MILSRIEALGFVSVQAAEELSHGWRVESVVGRQDSRRIRRQGVRERALRWNGGVGPRCSKNKSKGHRYRIRRRTLGVGVEFLRGKVSKSQ